MLCLLYLTPTDKIQLHLGTYTPRDPITLSDDYGVYIITSETHSIWYVRSITILRWWNPQGTRLVPPVMDKKIEVEHYLPGVDLGTGAVCRMHLSDWSDRFQVSNGKKNWLDLL